MNDTIDLLKGDGSVVEGLRASVQGSKIFMKAADLLVEPGDLIRRRMSNGGEETFEVIDPGFYEKHGGIPAHYQMSVRRPGALRSGEVVRPSVTYNIIGPNARLNQNSVDNSTNVAWEHGQALQLVAALRSEIESLEIPLAEREAALEIVGAVEDQVQSQKPSKALVRALLSALPSVASIVSITASLLSLLGH